MKFSSNKDKGRSSAFTLLEVCVVITTIALVVLLLLPALSRAKTGEVHPNCASNLHQVGTAFRMWYDDNGSYPMQYKNSNFDGPGVATQQNMYLYFQAMSNELSTPKVVVCPGDKKRTFATNFTSDFDNSKVSYFVGLDASATKDTMFLGGDRNISNGTKPQNHRLDLKTNQTVQWTQEIHKGQGNVLLSDGSVLSLTSAELEQALHKTGTNLIRLALP